MRNIRFIPKWLIVAAVLTALTIFIHEIAHYVTALAFGAENVKLHWLDVSYDPASLSRMAAAMTALAGPFSTYLIIIVVWLSGISGLAPLALGIGAASRNLVRRRNGRVLATRLSHQRCGVSDSVDRRYCTWHHIVERGGSSFVLGRSWFRLSACSGPQHRKPIFP